MSIQEQPDWSREEKSLLAWQPSRSLLASIRCYQRHLLQDGFLSWIVCKVAVLRHRFWSVVTGAEMNANEDFISD